jgi:hypothetical protein
MRRVLVAALAVPLAAFGCRKSATGLAAVDLTGTWSYVGHVTLVRPCTLSVTLTLNQIASGEAPPGSAGGTPGGGNLRGSYDVLSPFSQDCTYSGQALAGPINNGLVSSDAGLMVVTFEFGTSLPIRHTGTISSARAMGGTFEAPFGSRLVSGDWTASRP